jgi:hypothetical protein
MSWLLQQSEEDPEEDNDEDYDALKFLTMGWYVYTQILEGRTV